RETDQRSYYWCQWNFLEEARCLSALIVFYLLATCGPLSPCNPRLECCHAILAPPLLAFRPCHCVWRASADVRAIRLAPPHIHAAAVGPHQSRNDEGGNC